MKKYLNGVLVDMTEAEIGALPAPRTEAELLEEVSTEVRTQRNRLLSQTDYTQLADSPRDKQVWATYRQALRDITAQVGFPETINWPVAPE